MTRYIIKLKGLENQYLKNYDTFNGGTYSTKKEAKRFTDFVTASQIAAVTGNTVIKDK